MQDWESYKEQQRHKKIKNADLFDFHSQSESNLDREKENDEWMLENFGFNQDLFDQCLENDNFCIWLHKEYFAKKYELDQIFQACLS